MYLGCTRKTRTGAAHQKTSPCTAPLTPFSVMMPPQTPTWRSQCLFCGHPWSQAARFLPHDPDRGTGDRRTGDRRAPRCPRGWGLARTTSPYFLPLVEARVSPHPHSIRTHSQYPALENRGIDHSAEETTPWSSSRWRCPNSRARHCRARPLARWSPYPNAACGLTVRAQAFSLPRNA